jgi:hypothetical protein
MRVQFIERDTTEVLEQQIGSSGIFVPDRHDHVNIENKKWCVDSREVKDIHKGEVIVWLYDDTRRY